MQEVSSTLNFINHKGDPLTWSIIMESDEEEMEAITSDDRIVVITNATSIGIGAAGTGESGRRKEQVWFNVVEPHVNGAFQGIITARKLIEKETDYRVANGIPHIRWYEGMIASLLMIAEDVDEYKTASMRGFYSYFQMQH
ncbi:hypothetical protein OTK49_03130 [Vibrio coralliirubri]|uniref:hypothetical protein n=1 Tax=Vibrio coralliirubri TaxID=1516159 RepID=UPI0022836C71|nr:hypothetical protein [Vibrio coralliirubri]MCY9861509.1 hypothetical protein [Vibrio coralliirubri]